MGDYYYWYHRPSEGGCLARGCREQLVYAREAQYQGTTMIFWLACSPPCGLLAYHHSGIRHNVLPSLGVHCSSAQRLHFTRCGGCTTHTAEDVEGVWLWVRLCVRGRLIARPRILSVPCQGVLRAGVVERWVAVSDSVWRVTCVWSAVVRSILQCPWRRGPAFENSGVITPFSLLYFVVT